MPLSRYFKENQKALVKLTGNTDADAKSESLTCYLKKVGREHLDLTIPYATTDDERYPFDQGGVMEIYTESNGIGVCVTGGFEKHLSDKLVRFRHNCDLKMVQRRIEERCEATVDLGYTRAKGQLKSLNDQWNKNVAILSKPEGRSKLPNFPKVKANLSATGIGFAMKAPVADADLCLLYMDLSDGGTPLCILAEVVWHSGHTVNGRCMAGLQFLNILDSDRKRIARFVKAQLTTSV